MAKFLWDLTRKEVMDGVRAFIKATKLGSGNISGGYDLYSATVEEWQKAKKRKFPHG